MKAPLLLLLVVLHMSDRCPEQSGEERYNVDVQLALNAFGDREYLTAARAYARAFNGGFGTEDPVNDHYQAAVAWMWASRLSVGPIHRLQAWEDTAVLELHYLADRLRFDDYALLDAGRAFSELRWKPDYMPLRARLRANAQRNSPALDSLLADRLENARRWRTETRGSFMEHLHGQSPPPSRGTLDTLRIMDSSTLALVDSLIGMPGRIRTKQIGRSGVRAMITIAEGADPARLESYLPKLRKACVDAGIDPAPLAPLEDLLSLHQTGEQIYGTQVRCDTGSGCHVLPIRDPGNVDERRRAVGLEPMAELQNRGVRWNANSPRKSGNTGRAK